MIQCCVYVTVFCAHGLETHPRLDITAQSHPTPHQNKEDLPSIDHTQKASKICRTYGSNQKRFQVTRVFAREALNTAGLNLISCSPVGSETGLP